MTFSGEEPLPSDTERDAVIFALPSEPQTVVNETGAC